MVAFDRQGTVGRSTSSGSSPKPVDVIREAVGAVGDGAEGGARQALRVVVKMVVVFHDGREAVAPEERGELALAACAGGELRLQVAHHLVGQPHVGGHHVPDALHGLPASMNFT